MNVPQKRNYHELQLDLGVFDQKGSMIVLHCAMITRPID